MRRLPPAALGAAILLFLAAAGGAAAQPAPVTFKAGEVGKFPSGWQAREDEGRAVYTVRAEGERVFLHAESRKDAHQIGYELSADTRATPWLSFSWRALGLPPGGNERAKSTNDSALGVYVVFAGWGIPPKTIKYLWSTTLPAGETGESPFTSRAKFVVLRSGAGQAQRWVDEEVNVRDDYRRLFRDDDVPKIKGIGVLTDSDNTGTAAAGDYGPFSFRGERASVPAGRP